MIMRRMMLIAGVLLICFILFGCGAESKTSPTASTEIEARSERSFLIFENQLGQQIELKEQPKRIVILNTQLLQVFDDLGGKPIGIATAPGVAVPSGAASAQNLGLISNVNMEEILALKPDLVIGETVFHEKLKANLEDAGIVYTSTDINSIEDIRMNARLLGEILGKKEETEAELKAMDERIDKVVSQSLEADSTYAVLTIMMGNISIQKSNSIALDVAEQLGLKNIADEFPAGEKLGSLPFSMEKLVEKNPEYLFLIVHGTEEEGQKILKGALESNEAWSSLAAVKHDRYQFIPSSLFVNNPGLSVEKSFQYMADLIEANK